MLRRRVWNKYHRQIYPAHLLAYAWTRCATVTKVLRTLARKFEAVHRKTVMRRKIIPSVCLARRRGGTSIASSMMCNSSRSVSVESPLLRLARGCESSDCLGSDADMGGFYFSLRRMGRIEDYLSYHIYSIL